MNPTLDFISEWTILHGDATSKHLILGSSDVTEFAPFKESFLRQSDTVMDCVHFSRCPCPSVRFGSRTRDLKFLDVDGLSKAVAKFLGLPTILAPTLLGIEKFRLLITIKCLLVLFKSLLNRKGANSGAFEAIRHEGEHFNNHPVLVICYEAGLQIKLSSKLIVCFFRLR